VARRRLARTIAVALAVLGAWQVGHGAWIYTKAWLGQRLLQRAWVRTLAGEAQAKPWPWADTWPVARLRVPAHGVDLVVLDGVSGHTLAWAPGHAARTVPPGGPGTAVISGHRDTHFRFLASLRPGDELLAERAGRPPTRFVVREAVVVDARSAVIRSDGASARLALVTCYPFDTVAPGGPLRYVVVAEAASAAARHISGD
jgi:sortase A